MATYTIWYCDEGGGAITQIKYFSSLEYTKVIGDVGLAQIVLPYKRLSYEDPRRDRRIHIFRNQRLDFVGFIVRVEHIMNDQSDEVVILTAASPEVLLRRRIVANYTLLEPGGPGYRSGAVDDMMKTIVTESLISNQDHTGTPSPSRSISNYLQVAADSSDGPTVENSHSWQNVLTVLKDLQATSKAAGNEVFFYIPPAQGKLTFITRTGEPGRDVSDRVSFSQFNGTLAAASLAYDFSDEANKIYALGDGDLDSQLVSGAVDSDLVNLSAIGLSELAVSGTGLDTDELDDVAWDELSRHRPIAIMTAKIANNRQPVGNTHSPQYDYAWNYGDRVKVQFHRRYFNVIIRAVHVKQDAEGNETITARIEDLDYVS